MNGYGSEFNHPVQNCGSYKYSAIFVFFFTFSNLCYFAHNVKICRILPAYASCINMAALCAV